MTLLSKVFLYARLMRLDKPIGIGLLLWPTLTALWLGAAGPPPLLLIMVFVVGTVLMRSAGCAVNDWADRHVDAHVARTAQRVLARGEIAPREALIVAMGCTLLAALLLPLLRREAVVLAFPAVAIAASYPFFKRFFPLPQAWLGVAFSFGIPMAFAATRGEVTAVGLGLFAANLCWVVAYDTEYAMVDRDDDLRLGVHSSAVLFGRADVAIICVLYTAHIALLAAVGLAIEAGLPFFAGLVVAAGMSVYHYRLIRTRSREGCFKAFLHNNWLGFVVFVAVVIDYAVR